MDVIFFCFEHECTLHFSQIALKVWLCVYFAAPFKLVNQFRLQFLRVCSIIHLISFIHKLAMPARGYAVEAYTSKFHRVSWRKISGGYTSLSIAKEIILWASELLLLFKAEGL
jgi:hypothetical protein